MAGTADDDRQLPGIINPDDGLPPPNLAC